MRVDPLESLPSSTLALIDKALPLLQKELEVVEMLTTVHEPAGAEVRRELHELRNLRARAGECYLQALEREARQAPPEPER